MQYTTNPKDVKRKREALWHCYRFSALDKIIKRLERAGIAFTVEQTIDRGAGTKGSGYAVKVWIIHVPNLEQDKLAEILRPCLSKAARNKEKNDGRKRNLQRKWD